MDRGYRMEAEKLINKLIYINLFNQWKNQLKLRVLTYFHLGYIICPKTQIVLFVDVT